MATWEQLANDNLEAAKLLYDKQQYRSSVSRSYYAAYCALTGVLKQHHVDFGHGKYNPAHGQLRALIRNNMDPRRYSEHRRRSLTKALNLLLNFRITSDYIPGQTIDKPESLHALQLATGIMKDTRD